jgi:hypothetical protein
MKYANMLCSCSKLKILMAHIWITKTDWEVGGISYLSWLGSCSAGAGRETHQFFFYALLIGSKSIPNPHQSSLFVLTQINVYN